LYYTDVVVAGGGVMRVPSKDAEVLYVLPLEQSREWKRLCGIPPWLPDETVPIIRKEARFRVTVDALTVPVAAFQFPVTPALCMTAYKVQGKTTDCIFLLEWSAYFVWCVAFVVFTRVRQMCKLFLAEPLTWETAEGFKPPPELVAELARLRGLATAAATGAGYAGGSAAQVPADSAEAAAAATGGATREDGGARRRPCVSSPSSSRVVMGAALAVAVVVSTVAKNAASDPNFGLLAALGVANACFWVALFLSGHPRARHSGPTDVVARMLGGSSKPAGRPLPRRGVSAAPSVPAAAAAAAAAAATAAEGVEWPAPAADGAHFFATTRLAAAVVDADVALSPVTPAGRALVAAGLAVGAAGAQASGEEDELLVVGPGNERITRHVLRRFQPGNWLADENINGILSMLQLRNDADLAVGRAVPVCFFLNSFFFDTLMGGTRRRYNFDGVRRWTARRDLLAVDLIITVVKHGGGHGSHWTLAVVHTASGTVEHFDSNGARHPRVTSALGQWFRDAVRSGGGCPPRPAVPIEHGTAAPQQDNSDDCGAFCLAVASALTRLAPVENVTAARMGYYRLRLAAELLAVGRRPAV